MRPDGSAIMMAALALAACRPQEAAPVAGPSNEAQPATANAAVPPPAAAAAGNATAPSAAAGTVQGPLSPSGYRLIGTEPFWGGTVTVTEIVYSTPENQEGERIAVTADYGPENEVYTGALDSRPFVLTLSAGPCSDGMSDNVHAFTAVLQVSGETRNGCANPQPQ